MFYDKRTTHPLNTLSAKDKESDDYFMEQIDLAIAELVYEKEHLKKAYNYYNGVRDMDQFKHIEENFGIGTPTSIEFIPLIRRHIDVLVGEHLQNELDPTISCKDKETLSKIHKDKMDLINQEEIDLIKSQLNTNLYWALMSEEEKQQNQKPVDKASEDALAKLKLDIERDYVSEFEIAANYVMQHLIQNKNVDIYNKLSTLFLDLLIAGQCYYKVVIREMGQTPDIVVLSPFDVFTSKNFNSPYKKHSKRAVTRYWMSTQEILSRYGSNLDKEDLEDLRSNIGAMTPGRPAHIRSFGATAVGTLQKEPLSHHDYDNMHEVDEGDLYPVYEVEWLANTKLKTGEIITERFQGVRIGEDIYTEMEKAEDMIKGKSDPMKGRLSINGLSYDERADKPWSLVLATANLQDKYDILHFYRDTLIANSGTKGNFIDVAQIPTFLGHTLPERLVKMKAYQKQGMFLIDSSQDGRAGNLNTIFNGFDETVDGNAIQAIQYIIQQTEETCSAITGVYRERLGGIEQKDAVSNVQVGIKQSAIITKQYHKMMDSITTELLIDALNMCRISYEKGVTGSLILGNKLQKVFTIDPKKFCMTDYDVHIEESGKSVQDVETIKAITMELVKNNMVDIDISMEALTTKSLTEMKENVSRSFKQKKAENDQLQKAMEQLEQMKQQLDQASKEAQKLNTQNEMLKKQNDEARMREIEYRYRIESEKNRIAEEFNEGKLAIDKEKVDIEKLQLVDNNGLNDEVKY